MSLYANVIVDISIEKLDHPFTYRIPENLRDTIRVGMAVRFPFGKGNTVKNGYVLSLTDECRYDPEKVKELIDVDSKKTDIQSQMIALAWWMRQRYSCTMNQAMKTVMPVKSKIQVLQKKYIHRLGDDEAWQEAMQQAQRKHAGAQLRLLQALEEEPYIEQSYVTEHWKIASATIRSLESRGLLEILTEEPGQKLPFGADISMKKPPLNDQQQAAVDAFWEDYQRPDKHVWLLQGITGSGKTEVYLELIEKVIAQGKQVIVLIPEISLTPQTVMRFYRRFGDRIATVHSRLAAGEKYQQFLRAMKGEIDIMIGPRSALFTPFERLGLVIIDEEHEDSYKSETTPKYSAKEVAIRRCEMNDGMVVLGSATPSLESRFLADQGIYRKVLLTKRGVKGAVLPQVEIVDMRKEMAEKNRSILSRSLKRKMEERLARKEQIMLFLNRRGYSNCISCRSCGQAVMCPNCDISLTLHENNVLKCHYCGFSRPVMKECPSCGSPYLAGLGIGTERAVELVQHEFPEAKILRMDMDSTAKAGSHEKILQAFGNGEADILLGTQMIVKGHDFANVTLVGVLVADKSLYASTYRAAEKTFQLLTQAAGRAGRGDLAGEVVIQTYRPEHFAIVSAAKQDYEGFYGREISYRKAMGYPPVSRMLSVLVTSPDEHEADAVASQLAKRSETFFAGHKMLLNGPTPDSIGRINNQYRRIFFVRSKDLTQLIALQEQLSNGDWLDKRGQVVVELNLM